MHAFAGTTCHLLILGVKSGSHQCDRQPTGVHILEGLLLLLFPHPELFLDQCAQCQVHRLQMMEADYK